MSIGDRQLDPVTIIGKDRVIIAGSFAPAAAGAPTTLRGKGFTVVRTSTGKFTLTLNAVYGQLDSFTCTLQLATAADQRALAGPVDLSAKTAVIYAWDISGAAVTDIAANANNRVNFCLVLRASGQEN